MQKIIPAIAGNGPLTSKGGISEPPLAILGKYAPMPIDVIPKTGGQLVAHFSGLAFFPAN